MNRAHNSAEKLMSSLGLKPESMEDRKLPKYVRSNLPSPETYWTTHGVTFKTKKGWAMARCIFHDDTHASLGINVETGGFICHACGAKGGDVLSAYRLHRMS